MPLFAEAVRCKVLELLPEVQKTIQECVDKGDFESPEYEEASAVFYKRYFCRIDPFPEPVQTCFKNLADDPTTYVTM